MTKVLIDRELLEEAIAYTSSPSWSPSLTEELRAVLAAQPATTENKFIVNSNGKYSPLLTYMMNKRTENKP
jgi:hypothetical protein